MTQPKPYTSPAADKWPGRQELLATFIEPGASVLDIGCGARGLAGRLPPDCRYLGLDLPDFDMDADDAWPTERYDYAVLAGVLEFATRPDAVLRSLRLVADTVLLSYGHQLMRRYGFGLTSKDLRTRAEAAGWVIERIADWETSRAGTEIRFHAIWRLT